MSEQLIDISDIKLPKGLRKIPFYLEPKFFEFSYALFEACNLRCTFCFEGHRNNKVDISALYEVPQHIFQNLKEDLEKYSSIKDINLRFWGGELFYDALSDAVFDAYKFIVDECRKLINKEYPDINLRFSWLTNGVWTKWERVKELLDYSNGVLGFSYDPDGRFLIEAHKEQMINNVLRFNEMGFTTNLSITLTKKTIEKYVNNESDINRFPKHIKFDVNYYTANPKWESLICEDDDLFNFFKWALEEGHFNINVVENLLAAGTGNEIYFKGHYCDCKTCKQFSNGYCTVDCAKRASILPRSMFYGKYTDEIDEENVSEAKLAIGYEKMGCLYCEYNNLCQMPCWITVVFQGYKPTNCPFKRIYEYIKKNPHIEQNYLKWRELYGN